MFQKFSRDRWKIRIFLERKSRNRLFFNFFITKVSYFVSNLNDDFHEASFEVYYISVSQKLTILGFSPQIFFILTSVTSDTSWGQTMSLSDLNEVSNFSWRCQLSYETMFVWSVPKLECPETVICHRDTLIWVKRETLNIKSHLCRMYIFDRNRVKKWERQSRK